MGVGSGISGGVVNPAIAFALNILSKLHASNDDSIGNLWPYLVGPLVGGALSALFYNLYHCGAVECCKGDDDAGKLDSSNNEMSHTQ